MASGLPEKLSVTMLLAAIRRLQQRDCPGFSPDSLLIAVPPIPIAARGDCEPIAGAKVSINRGITKFFSKKT